MIGHSLLREVHSSQEVLKAGVVPQAVEDRVDTDSGHVGVMRIVCLFQPMEGFFVLAGTGIQCRDSPRGDMRCA